MTALFLRLLPHDDKAAALADAVAAVREGRTLNPVAHTVDPASFRQVPGSPFAYWVSDRIRRLFTELPAFESEGRTVKQGLATADDFRFVRAWWEVKPESIVSGQWSVAKSLERQTTDNGQRTADYFRRQTFEGKRWVPFAKGGEYSPYYADLHLVVNWEWDGEEIRNFVDPETRRPYSRPQNTDFYFRPGLTWPLRSTSGFGIRILPSGCIFSHKGPGIVVETAREMSTLGILFSRLYQRLVEVGLAAGDETHSGTPARSYEVGIIQKLPWPNLREEDIQQLMQWVGTIVRGVSSRDVHDETTKFFVRPITLAGRGIREAAVSWQRASEKLACELLELAAKIDTRVAEILGVRDAEQEDVSGGDAATLLALPDGSLGPEFDDVYTRSIYETIQESLEESGGNRQVAVKSFYVSRHLEVLAGSLKVNPKHIVTVTADRNLVPDRLEYESVHALLSYCFGCTVGRWDIRFATGELPAPELPDPFAPLPAYSPGMLTPERATDDGQRTTDKSPLTTDKDGLLVDDPDHPDDLIRRVREVLEVIWGERAEAIEREACEILGGKELRDYFRKPGNGGFWMDHVKRYSKSRRKAPIYWLLQSSKKNYALWLYYHRLNKDILFKALVNYVEPKLRLEESRLEAVRRQLSVVRGGAAGTTDDGPRTTDKKPKTLEKQLDRQEALLSELHDFHDKLRRAADLHIEPDLNDGVILNIAPLWELVPWNEAKAYWEELLAGKYEWSSIGKQLRQKGLVGKG